MTAADPRDGLLPDLPTPAGPWHATSDYDGYYAYTADQMHEMYRRGKADALAHARPEAVDYKAALQAAVDGIEVPKMTAARAEYYKAGARAAIAAMNAALTPERAP